jgi:aminocarboxymuconate-semialdehyde decarboxylase
MVIDTHAHIIVPEITLEAAPEETWRPQVYWEGGKQIIEFGGRKIGSTLWDFVHIELILEAQDEAGVDRILLAPWVTLLKYDAEVEEGLRISRIQNDALTRLAQRYSDRVSVLGTVPLQDPELAANELKQVMATPGLKGVEIASSVNGTFLGDARFKPFWAAAEETGALIFIHPTTRGFSAPVFNEFYMWNTVGNPLETTITAAHMINAGVMEDFPGLKVLLAHGGGAILSLWGRLNHAHSFQPQAKSVLKEKPEDSLKRFYFDTVVHDPALLRTLVDFAGADHVMVGSDYPFDMGVARPGDIVRQLNLPSSDEEQILSGNALRLMQ